MNFPFLFSLIFLSTVSILRAKDNVHFIESGMNLNLQCKSDLAALSNPIKYEWFDPQKNLKGTDINLIIPNFSKENQGLYVCKITELIDGKLMTWDMYINVQLKPQDDKTKTHQVPKTYKTFVTGTILLYCNSTKGYTNEYKYEWILPNSSRYDSEIFLKKASITDNGLYTCLMTNKSNGAVANEYTYVYVNQLPLSIEKVSGQLIQGEISTFKCSVDESKTDNKIETKFTYTWKDPKGQIVGNNQIIDIKITDQSSFGTYTCIISDESMHPPYSQNIGFMLKSAIYSGSDNENKNENSNISNDTVEVEAGTTVNLQCKSSTDSNLDVPIKYEWFNPQNKFIGSNVNIIIPNFSLENEGIYSCKVTEIVDGNPISSKKSINVRIKDQKGDNANVHKVLVPKIYETFATGIVYLRCTVAKEKDKEYKFEWITPFNQIKPGDSIYIKKVRLTDNGFYTCRVTRLSDRVISQAQTKVIVKQLPVEITKVSGLLVQGQTVTFKCSVDKIKTDRKVLTNFSYEWRNPSGELIGNDQDIDIKMESDLSFGKYTCTVLDKSMNPFYSQIGIIELKGPNKTNTFGRSMGEIIKMNFTVQFGSVPTTIKYSDPVELVCNISPPFPGAIYEILFNNILVSKSNSYKIDKFRKEDIGTYICKVKGFDLRTRQRVNANAVFVINAEKETVIENIRSIEDLIVRDLSVNNNNIRVLVFPSVITLQSGQSASFQCLMSNNGNNTIYPEVIFANGSKTIDNPRISIENLESGKIQFTFSSVTINENGTKFICQYGKSKTEVLVIVEEICINGFRLCKNGRCIESSKFCDGTVDCDDRSDEDTKFCKQCDPLTKRCEVYDGKQPTSRTFQAHWLCDGDDDCGNGFDESKCSDNDMLCGGLTYHCLNESKIIPRAYLCDKDKDCVNEDDESNCEGPKFIYQKNSVHKVETRVGNTTTFTCEGIAFPLPTIIWRFNWGCLNDEKRMITSNSYKNCNSTVSKLTITNAQIRDQGSYICEILSGGQRSWSNEYQLSIN